MSQTPKQRLASLLRMKEYRGCRGQVTHWHDGAGIELFASNTQEMRDRFPGAEVHPHGHLVIGFVPVR